MNRLTHVAGRAITIYQTSTSSMRLMPDFIIIGVARGGTTSLYNYLIEHPSITPGSRKEIHFFDYHFRRGISWYRGQFPYSMQKFYAKNVRKRDFLTGEASPYYIYHPYAPKRVAEALPQVKLILLLRNPVERAFSHYSWEVSSGFEKLSFEDAIGCEKERIKEGLDTLVNKYSFNHQHFSYLTRGIYVDQLETWFSLFPREQFLILRSEDLYKDPAAIFKQTIEFLKVPYTKPKELNKEFKQYNQPKLASAQKMDPAMRKRLLEYFEPHNARLYELIGRDFGWN